MGVYFYSSQTQTYNNITKQHEHSNFFHEYQPQNIPLGKDHRVFINTLAERLRASFSCSNLPQLDSNRL